jgi:hypothetical protein
MVQSVVKNPMEDMIQTGGIKEQTLPMFKNVEYNYVVNAIYVKSWLRQFHSDILGWNFGDVIQGYQETIDFGSYEIRQSEIWSLYLIEAYHQLSKLYSQPEKFGFNSTYESQDMVMEWKIKMGSEIKRWYQLNKELTNEKTNQTSINIAMFFSPPAIRKSSSFMIDLPQDYIPDDEDLNFAVSIYKTVLETEKGNESQIDFMSSNLKFISIVGVIHWYYNMSRTRVNFWKLWVELDSLKIEEIMQTHSLSLLIWRFLNYNANFSAKQALGDCLEIFLTVVHFPNRWGIDQNNLPLEYHKMIIKNYQLKIFQNYLFSDFSEMIETFKNIPDFFKEVKDGFSDTVLKSMLGKLKKNAKKETNAEQEEFKKLKEELLDYAEKK